MLLSLLSILFVLAAQAQQSPSQSVSLPEHSLAISPNRRYVIVRVNSDTGPHHTIFLEDRQSKTRRKLFNYERHIGLLWNPDSKTFALTDYAGSDYSKCSIVSVNEKVPSVDVWEKLVKAVSGKEQKSLLGNHHVYIAATEWLDSNRLTIKAWGYGDVDSSGSGFTRFYIYDIHRGISRDRR